ncbi:hypothetical protein [endosymbiont GvMRE of Glomus versiforme]|uniref:hypothetical protein n=1 Tax=endosymbiont GvMRE of Glomus versiforme TaxID=2039283 RepID=UPI000EC58E6F|nr:hypothetical protein [endosymbiont GvMRE of Glomus versiforme]RHZ35680.1 hypothetical protein GvMRE_IIg499 [endosymbiont GvMRE of Glomus versiforme]
MKFYQKISLILIFLLLTCFFILRLTPQQQDKKNTDKEQFIREFSKRWKTTPKKAKAFIKSLAQRTDFLEVKKEDDDFTSNLDSVLTERLKEVDEDIFSSFPKDITEFQYLINVFTYRKHAFLLAMSLPRIDGTRCIDWEKLSEEKKKEEKLKIDKKKCRKNMANLEEIVRTRINPGLKAKAETFDKINDVSELNTWVNEYSNLFIISENLISLRNYLAEKHSEKQISATPEMYKIVNNPKLGIEMRVDVFLTTPEK